MAVLTGALLFGATVGMASVALAPADRAMARAARFNATIAGSNAPVAWDIRQSKFCGVICPDARGKFPFLFGSQPVNFLTGNTSSCCRPGT